MSKKNIIKGTLILTATGICTKILGFINRIFLTRIIGVKQLGIYQLIFPLYILSLSICCQAVSTSITKNISSQHAKNNYSGAKIILKKSFILSFSLSLLFFCVYFFLAKPISLYLLKNSDCIYLLKVISLAIPFVSIKACINAYFIGVNKPFFNGIIQLTEQIIRIIITYLLFIYIFFKRKKAIIAVLGVLIGEIISSFLALIFFISNRRKYNTNDSNMVRRDIHISFSNILNNEIIPLTINNIFFNLFTTFESITMPSMLYKYYSNANIAMEKYGIISGIVIPFLLFPATITGSLSLMLLPSISSAHVNNDIAAIKKTIMKSSYFCIILGCVSWIAYLILGKQICIITFNNETAGTFLQFMSFICPLIYLSNNLTYILNGLGMSKKILYFSTIATSVRILCLLFFVPHFGIKAYTIGMAIGYFVLNLLLSNSLSCKLKKGL